MILHPAGSTEALYQIVKDNTNIRAAAMRSTMVKGYTEAQATEGASEPHIPCAKARAGGSVWLPASKPHRLTKFNFKQPEQWER